MKRYTIPRVAHCSNGCSIRSRVRRKNALIQLEHLRPIDKEIVLEIDL